MTGYSDADFLFATLREFQKSFGQSEKTTLHIENVGNQAWMNFTILLSISSNHQKPQEAILFNSVTEFFRRWTSGKDSRIKIDYQGNDTCLNFSAVLGNPGTSVRRTPKPKSARKIQRDNQRAAAHNEARKKLFQKESESFSVSDVASTEEQAGDVESQVTASEGEANPGENPGDHHVEVSPEQAISQSGNPTAQEALSPLDLDPLTKAASLTVNPENMEFKCDFNEEIYRRKITCDQVSERKTFADDVVEITSSDGTTVRKQLTWELTSNWKVKCDNHKDVYLKTFLAPCSHLEDIIGTQANHPLTARMILFRLYTRDLCNTLPLHKN